MAKEGTVICCLTLVPDDGTVSNEPVLVTKEEFRPLMKNTLATGIRKRKKQTHSLLLVPQQVN